MGQLILALCLNFSVVILAPKKKMLTISGAVTAFFIGILFYLLGGFFSWLLLILFFVSSSVIGKIKKYFGLNQESDLVKEEKTGRRAIQVIANSVPALVCLVFFYFSKEISFYLAMVATIAGATADTWASEIGILSKHRPVSILTLRPMASGLSGGITKLGVIASLFGAGFISLCFSLFYFNKIESIKVFFLYNGIILFSGFVSSLIDSVLGILIQEKYQLENQVITEIKESQSSVRLYSGIRGIDNNMVNLITGILTAVVATGCSFLLL